MCILYIVCHLHNTFWKEQRNVVPQGTEEFATQRDPLQGRGSIPKYGSDLRWQWGTTSSSSMWLTLLKVTSPSSLPFYCTPHHHKLGLPSALLSFRPSPQCRSQMCRSVASCVPRGFPSYLCMVTSVCFAKNMTRLFLTQPASELRGDMTQPQPLLFTLLLWQLKTTKPQSLALQSSWSS